MDKDQLRQLIADKGLYAVLEMVAEASEELADEVPASAVEFNRGAEQVRLAMHRIA